MRRNWLRPAIARIKQRTSEAPRQDTASTYVRDPGGGLLGSKTGANATYSWTDLHIDVVGQFTATATALNGSTTYEPFGKVNATNAMQGSLGYQSEWTDAQTRRVNMHARWYNPDTSQFDSRDTVKVSNRYNYVDNNPLTSTDPTGHMANWREKIASQPLAAIRRSATGRPAGQTPDSRKSDVKPKQPSGRASPR